MIRKDEPWHRGDRFLASQDTELVRGGMPTWGLAVWLPAKRIAYLEHWLQMARAFGGTGKPEYRAELERLTGQPVKPGNLQNSNRALTQRNRPTPVTRAGR